MTLPNLKTFENKKNACLKKKRKKRQKFVHAFRSTYLYQKTKERKKETYQNKFSTTWSI
jgi:hypothetical protein